MLREMCEGESEKAQVFQIMLLNNDRSDEVEIHETEKVDFSKIAEHLTRGGSVFITSKSSQKLATPTFKQKGLSRKKPLKTVTAFYFDHV